MESKIILNYLTNELGESQAVAKRNLEELDRHPDIKSELAIWIQHRKFPENPIVVEGYTAKEICKTSYLLPIGAYNFLVFLREEPENALNDIKMGFPKK